MSNNRKQETSINEVILENEIFQAAVSLSDEALLSVNQLLSIWGMTALQYNALHIMYVKDDDEIGLASKEIGQSLYTRVPDVTRLLDRLADKGWVSRERDMKNRRIVRSQLTSIGIELVESISQPMKELESKQYSSLSKSEKETLVHLLNKALDK